jgi:hypothetical protein
MPHRTMPSRAVFPSINRDLHVTDSSSSTSASKCGGRTMIAEGYSSRSYLFHGLRRGRTNNSSSFTQRVSWCSRVTTVCHAQGRQVARDQRRVIHQTHEDRTDPSQDNRRQPEAFRSGHPCHSRSAQSCPCLLHDRPAHANNFLPSSVASCPIHGMRRRSISSWRTTRQIRRTY